MGAKRKDKGGSRWKLVIAVVAATLLLALSFFLPLAEWAESLENELVGESFVVALAIFTAAYVLATMLFAPAWIFPVAAGAAFGLVWGFFAALTASAVSATAAFLGARYVLRDAVTRRAHRHRLFKELNHAVTKDGWKFVVMLRLTPVLPFAVKNYFLGLTRIRLLPYVLATAAGMFPGLLVKVYLGAVGRAALGLRDPLQWGLLALGFAASVALTWWLTRLARGRLHIAFPQLP